MANTYTQLHHQFVFATKFREASIGRSWKEELHKYITAIVQDRDHKMLQINSMPDHIHMLIGLRPKESVSSILKSIKQESSRWINQRRFCRAKFTWQDGYGAFSYSKKDLDNVILYIQHQEGHHRKQSFRNEYIQMLNDAEIDFDEQYIFHEPI